MDVYSTHKDLEYQAVLTAINFNKFTWFNIFLLGLEYVFLKRIRQMTHSGNKDFWKLTAYWQLWWAFYFRLIKLILIMLVHSMVVQRGYIILRDTSSNWRAGDTSSTSTKLQFCSFLPKWVNTFSEFKEGRVQESIYYQTICKRPLHHPLNLEKTLKNMGCICKLQCMTWKLASCLAST